MFANIFKIDNVCGETKRKQFCAKNCNLTISWQEFKDFPLDDS